jgi:hypothetical protein
MELTWSWGVAVGIWLVDVCAGFDPSVEAV